MQQAFSESVDQTFRSAGMVDLDLSYVFMLVLFIVFAVLLYKIVVQPLMEAQQQRFAGTGGAREDASTAELAAAEARLAYETDLAKARQDAVLVRDELRDAAVKESQGLLAAAKTDVEAAMTAGRGEISNATKQARGEMNKHVDELSTLLAERLLAGKGS